MLQAQIDIIDQAGHIEESATILGSGRVSVGTRLTGGYLHADEGSPDVVVVAQDGSRVWFEVKAANSLQLGEFFVGAGNHDITASATGGANPIVAFIKELGRYLQVKLLIVSAEILSGNAVIRSTQSSLVSRARASAARGAVEVTQQLERLRAQGKIDEHGDILVNWPEDMKPGSPTDL